MLNKLLKLIMKNEMINPWVVFPLMVLTLFIIISGENKEIELELRHNQNQHDHLYKEVEELKADLNDMNVDFKRLEEKYNLQQEQISNLAGYILAVELDMKERIGNIDHVKYDSMFGEVWQKIDILDKRTKFD